MKVSMPTLGVQGEARQLSLADIHWLTYNQL
jgi:hypothetical protein